MVGLARVYDTTAWSRVRLEVLGRDGWRCPMRRSPRCKVHRESPGFWATPPIPMSSAAESAWWAIRESLAFPVSSSVERAGTDSVDASGQTMRLACV